MTCLPFAMPGCRAKLYRVNLTQDERKHLLGITRRGQSSGRKVKRCLILCKADEGLTGQNLDRQHVLLESYCAAQGWSSLVIRDLGSGMNYRKKGLHQLLELILERRMRRLVITHKDRLLRFGAELVFTLCELNGIEVVVIHQGEQPSFEEELAQDVLEIITVFSARLYGSRSRKHRKLLDTLAETVPGQVPAGQHS